MTANIAERDVTRLAQCMADGGVAVFPTDTVYGVCCDPANEQAARRLYELKGRPPARPAAVMFFSVDSALAALPELPESERLALEVLLPAPLTLLLSNRVRRFASACRTDPETLGLRVPRLPAHLDALKAMSTPVMQSSANLSGEPDARTLEEVPAGLRDGADLVIDGGELPGTPSTVIDLRDYGVHRRWHILREGALPRSAVQDRLTSL
jgi:L-threonylcarbamoyladenylate synthase